MNKWNGAQFVFAGIGLILTAVIFWMAEARAVKWMAVLLLAWQCGWFWMIRKRQTFMLEKQRNEQLSGMLRILRHQRHNWMNGLQVLYGYIKLKKYDKLATSMEAMKEKLQQESRASKLGDPELEWYLLSLAANCPKFELEIESAEGLDLSVSRVPLFADTVLSLARMFEQVSDPPEAGEDQFLILNFDEVNRSLCCSFDYEGRYDEQAVRDKCEETERRFDREPGAKFYYRTETGRAFIDIVLPIHP